MPTRANACSHHGCSPALIFLWSQGHKNANEFNCTQRAHQNTLENLPQFFVLLFLGGLQYPLVSAIGGAVFLAGRVVYALGYSTGDPNKRMRGVFGYLGFFALLFSAIAFGLRLLEVIA